MLRQYLLLATVGIATIIACSSDPSAAPDTPSGDDDDADSGKMNTSSSSSSSGAPVSTDITTSTVTVDVNGTSRIYILSLPKTYDANKKYPLIVALHGDGETAEFFLPFSKLDVVAGKDAVMAFTDGSVDVTSAYDDNIDEQLVQAVVDDVKKKQSIDTKKIWGFGYSKGAFQLGELGCRKPGIFTAMAIHAGGAPGSVDATERNQDGSVNCPAATALPVFVTQGSDDNEIGAEFHAQFWASVAGCNDTRSKATPAICEKYNGCQASNPVYYCVVPNHGHYPIYDNAAADSWAWFNSLGQ